VCVCMCVIVLETFESVLAICACLVKVSRDDTIGDVSGCVERAADGGADGASEEATVGGDQ
jgi:hypothetical protein